MPRRLRTSKRRDELTANRWWLLTIGPLAGPDGKPGTGPRPYPVPGTDAWEALRTCWLIHRGELMEDAIDRGDGYWGHRVFDLDEDPEDVSNRLILVGPVNTESD